MNGGASGIATPVPAVAEDSDSAYVDVDTSST